MLCRRPPSRVSSRGPPPAGVPGVLSGLGPPKQPHFNATTSGKAQHPKPATACAGGATQPLEPPHARMQCGVLQLGPGDWMGLSRECLPPAPSHLVPSGGSLPACPVCQPHHPSQMPTNGLGLGSQHPLPSRRHAEGGSVFYLKPLQTQDRLGRGKISTPQT